MAVSLTERAAERVRGFLAQRGKGGGLRLGIKTVGCSGKAYVLDYADGVAANDMVFESHGVKVIVDKDSLALLEGTVVDYGKNGMNESFTFSNPNEKGRCGCGESFSV